MTTPTDALRYEVPDHQGQEVLGAALQEHGYAWSSEFTGGRTHLVITSADGTVDREKVRKILSRQHRASLSGPDIIYTEVRFEDEPHPAGSVRNHTPVREPGTQPGARPGPRDHETPGSPTDTPRRTGLGGPLARAAVGGVLLTFPRAITGALIRDPDQGDRVLLRLLGARHLVQAVVCAARPTPVVLTTGAVTDLLHGGSALAYAALRPDRRRAALLSAAVAFTFAAEGLRRARG